MAQDSRDTQKFSPHLVRIRVDRMAPTWRGQELAAVLIDGLYEVMEASNFGRIAPGYDTEEARLNVLTDWAAQISDRGYLVVLNLLQKQQDPVNFEATLIHGSSCKARMTLGSGER